MKSNKIWLLMAAIFIILCFAGARAETLQDLGAIRYPTPDNMWIKHCSKRAIQWSPDSEWIIFSGCKDGDDVEPLGLTPASTLWIVRPDGSGLKRISCSFDNPSHYDNMRIDSYLKWANDSRYLYFSSSNASSIIDLLKSSIFRCKFPLDGSLYDLVEYGGDYFDISSDGRWLVYNTDKPQGIWIYDQKEKVKRLVKDDNGEPITWYDFSISPDNSYIAFSSEVPGINKMKWKGQEYTPDDDFFSHLYLFGLNNFQKRLLYPNLSSMDTTLNIRTPPAWSPDSKKLAFVTTYVRDGFISKPYQVEIAGVDGEQLMRFEFDYPPLCSSPVWSPNGKKVIFQTLAFTHTLGIIDVENKKISFIEHENEESESWHGGEEKYSNPIFSPDGKHLALAILSPGTYDKYRLVVIDLKEQW